MDKLVITKEQKGALKQYRDEGLGFIQYMQSNSAWYGKYSKLRYFTPEQFALLLCGWYEVKPEYNPGQWLFIGEGADTLQGKSAVACIEKIDSGEEYDLLHLDDGTSIGSHSNHIRKATLVEIAREKRRRKWSEINREEKDYRKGDIVSTGSITRPIVDISGEDLLIEGMPFTNTYTADEIFMVCPVEKRFDR